MRSQRDVWPARMERVAVVAPESRVRAVLVTVAEHGVFEPDDTDVPSGELEALAATDHDGGDADEPVVSFDPPDVGAAGSSRLTPALLRGERLLERRRDAMLRRGRCLLLPGWMRTRDVEGLRASLEPLGGAVVELPGRPGLLPPTAYSDSRAGAAFRPLVSTYGTVPYVDVDPTLFAAFSYLLMFGMMFGDVGHGLAIVAVGTVALVARRGRVAALRPMAWFLVGAGVAATVAGFLYGEAFGPTGLVPTLWIRPLDEPETFLVAGLAVGMVLLAATFVLSIVNRWQEGGASLAIYDPSGVAGALLLIGVAAAVAGVAWTSPVWWWIALGIVLLAVVLLLGGFLGRPGEGGVAQALVELFDTLLRLGSNVVSFTRLAAFGLTHAVITEVVWDGTVALWDRGAVPAWIGAVALFSIGNLAAFALGALVAAIQALRLEYYELFSRLFTTSGRPFTPWTSSVRRSEVP